MACDLHVHSTASDGGFTPSEVVERAHSIGLSCLSLTDHDTVAGIAEARHRAAQLDLAFINGIEMTAVHEGSEYHILGYFVDHESRAFQEALDMSWQFTRQRLSAICDKLTALGMPVTIEEVIAKSGKGSMGRPHVAAMLLEKGFISSQQEAFDLYIGTEGTAYVPPVGRHPEEVYGLIRDAGGIPGLAHPGLLGRADMVDENEMRCHREWGARAIEVFHPRHDDYLVSYYLKLARQLDMGITGGSDCHGPVFPRIMMDRKQVPDWVAEKFYEFQERYLGDKNSV